MFALELRSSAPQHRLTWSLLFGFHNAHRFRYDVWRHQWWRNTRFSNQHLRKEFYLVCTRDLYLHRVSSNMNRIALKSITEEFENRRNCLRECFSVAYELSSPNLLRRWMQSFLTRIFHGIRRFGLSTGTGGRVQGRFRAEADLSAVLDDEKWFLNSEIAIRISIGFFKTCVGLRDVEDINR